MSFVLFGTVSQCCNATSILDGIIFLDPSSSRLGKRNIKGMTARTDPYWLSHWKIEPKWTPVPIKESSKSNHQDGNFSCRTTSKPGRRQKAEWRAWVKRLVRRICTGSLPRWWRWGYVLEDYCLLLSFYREFLHFQWNYVFEGVAGPWCNFVCWRGVMLKLFQNATVFHNFSLKFALILVVIFERWNK